VTGDWPELPYATWRDTRDTLHLYLQVVGKVRHTLSPVEPDWGHAPLYRTARGLTTPPIPHPSGGVFDIDVDLVDHAVTVRTVRGGREQLRLEPRTVAAFYGELMAALARLDVPAEIATNPSDVEDGIPFPLDNEHASYDPEWAHRFWRVLVCVHTVLAEHRAHFAGRVTPVQLWWGSFDLSYARYADPASHWAAGFWPGDPKTPEASFYAYGVPKPDGIEQAPGWSEARGEFLLPYDTVRAAADPRRALLEFLDSTYSLVSGYAG
jgi:Family of unknown function (DUF5996)